MTKLSIKYFNSDLCLFMSMSSFDWSEISKSKKGVRTSDNKACGEVISTPREEIFIVDGAINIKKYKIPKSKIKFYNGSELVLQIPTSLMKQYEYQ